MLFFRLCSTAILLQFLLFATPAMAQLAPNTTPGFEQYLNLWGLDKDTIFPTPRTQPQVEGPLPLPRARPHDHSQTPAKKPKFSEWGYRHRELHDKGIIAEMLKRLVNANCCDGIESGECRVSEVDLSQRLVLIDGDWCPMDNKTRVTPLESLGDIIDGNRAVAVVCASNTYGKRCETTSYCVGVKEGT